MRQSCFVLRGSQRVGYSNGQGEQVVAIAETTHYKEIQIMRLMKVLPIVILSLASSMAIAKDKNKVDEVNCGNLDNDKLRKECRERKYGSSDGKKVDCSKLNSDKLRHECRQEKWN